MLDLENMSTTEQEAYSMSISVALQTLNDIMLDKDVSTEERRWAAELVLKYNSQADWEDEDDDE